MASAQDPLHIDGSTLEGGGQLVRIAVGLSALLRCPIHLTSIRKGRPSSSGLKGQHLAAITWLARACNAEVRGMALRSTDLVFIPSPLHTPNSPSTSTAVVKPVGNVLTLEGGTRARSLSVSLDTPGATTLVLQCLLPFLIFSNSLRSATTTPTSSDDQLPTLLTLRGGTNVSFAPSIDYVDLVLFPTLAALGIPHASVLSVTRGWSTGRSVMGEARILVHRAPPSIPIPGFSLKPDPSRQLQRIDIAILAPGPTARSALRANLEQTLSASQSLLHSGRFEQKTVTDEDSGHTGRWYVLLAAVFSDGTRHGVDWLYGGGRSSAAPKAHETKSRERELLRKMPKGQSAVDDHELCSQVAQDLVSGLVRELEVSMASGCRLDGWMQDQVVVFQALSKGRCAGGDGDGQAVSLHTRTARWVVGKMLGVEWDEDGGCEGVAFGASG